MWTPPKLRGAVLWYNMWCVYVVHMNPTKVERCSALNVVIQYVMCLCCACEPHQSWEVQCFECGDTICDGIIFDLHTELSLVVSAWIKHLHSSHVTHFHLRFEELWKWLLVEGCCMVSTTSKTERLNLLVSVDTWFSVRLPMVTFHWWCSVVCGWMSGLGVRPNLLVM